MGILDNILDEQQRSRFFLEVMAKPIIEEDNFFGINSRCRYQKKKKNSSYDSSNRRKSKKIEEKDYE